MGVENTALDDVILRFSAFESVLCLDGQRNRS